MKRRAILLTLLLAAVHGVVGASDKAKENEAKKPASGATETKPPAKPAPSFDLDFTPPPGGEWIVGPDGREYFLEEIPLYEGYYQWENPERTVIRISFGARYDVASIDDQAKTAKIKIYRPQSLPRRAPPPTPSAAERERLLGTYRFEPESVNRLLFTARAETLPARGQWRNGFDLADFNGDGHLDIVHGPPRKGGTRPLVFLGDGKGGFTTWKAVRFPADAHLDYGDVAAADFTADGKVDLAVASHLRGTQVFVGDGLGSFRRWSEGIDFHPDGAIAGRPVFSSRALRVADWDGDGKLDLLAFGEGPRLVTSRAGDQGAFNKGSRGLRVYLNRGDGTWMEIRDPGSLNYADDFAIADLNGDGRRDVLAASSIAGYRALLNIHQPDDSWLPTIVPDLRPEAVIRAVAVDDFDADGKTDFALTFTATELGEMRSGIDLYLRRDTERWERRSVYALPSRGGFPALAAGDLDGDGKKDLVAFDADGGSAILLGDGRGSFARQPSPEVQAGDPGCRGFRVRLADLDGDGGPEMVANFAGESETAFRLMVGLPQICQTGGSLRVWDVAAAATTATTPTTP